MKTDFQFILDNYNKEPTKINSGTEVYKRLVKELPNQLRKLLKRDDLIVKGSMGQGNKAEYPWISIMNKNITNTTQKGVYLVYLFKKDMSGFYLSINQGFTHFEKTFGKDKYKQADKVSEYIRSEIASNETQWEIRLGDSKTHDYGYKYEKTNVIGKYYPSNNFNDEILKKDLLDYLETYDLFLKHIDTKGYDDVVKFIANAEDQKLINSSEAVEMIKEVVDPENDMPFGFNREIQEVEPKKDRSTKLKRITNPKVTKIDYVKKQMSDLKNGLIGEELAMNYEKQRLVNEGHEDWAEEILWVSKESGDGYGYDIRSFIEDKNGQKKEIHIEVKTTQTKVDTDFFVSRNEVQQSIEDRDSYCVYRIYDCKSEKPKFYKAFGKIEDNFILDPFTYTARYKF